MDRFNHLLKIKEYIFILSVKSGDLPLRDHPTKKDTNRSKDAQGVLGTGGRKIKT